MKIDQSNFKKGLTNRNEYFSKYIEAKDYSSQEDIITAFPHLVSLKREGFKISNPCHSLVIRSGNDDNIHKAIKYGVWTTTYKNKNKLEEYWEDHLKRGVDTYLFFSAVKSGHFQGVARLASGYHEETFPFWWENQHGKFKGHFDIEWLYIKDITYRYFEGLRNQQDEDVTKSRDCDQLSQQTTNKMLSIYESYNKNKTIFSSFQFFDEREQTELRAELTLEQQQQIIYMEQLRQMQIQQMMYPQMAMGQVYDQGVKQPSQHNGAAKQFVPNNPGFQMNPVSTNKKHKS